MRRALERLYQRSSEWGVLEERFISSSKAKIVVAYSPRGRAKLRKKDQLLWLREMERFGWVKRVSNRLLVVFKPK